MTLAIFAATVSLLASQAPQTQPPLNQTPVTQPPATQVPVPPPQANPPVPYQDDQLGLSFNHPPTWILETGQTDQSAPKKKRGKKKKKKGDDTVVFRIPLPGAVDDAELSMWRAGFSGSPDVWQQLQSNTNKDLKRTVERQWQEEILGVPLLLTRITYTENGTSKTILTGLLYNDSPSKLLFRLTGPTSDFDKAQYEFTTATESLRTTNNTLPKAQDPDHPATTEPKPDDKGQKHALFVPGPPPKPKLAPISVPIVVSTKHIELRIPNGWTATHVDGAGFRLENLALGYPLQVTVATSLDSDPAMTALVKASGASLAEFDSVTKREDSPVEMNAGGCTVTSVWRTGTTSKGVLITMEAAGVEGDFYFIATCHPVPGPTYLAQKKAIELLLQQISIETGG